MHLMPISPCQLAGSLVSIDPENNVEVAGNGRKNEKYSGLCP